MNLIENFDMPDFCRTKWVSTEAKEEWEPIKIKISRFFTRLSVKTVYENIRDGATTFISEEDWGGFCRDLQNHGLKYCVIGRTTVDSGFSHYQSYNSDDSGDYHVALARTEGVAKKLAEAIQQGDFKRSGLISGYPECCIDFFVSKVRDQYFDPVWQQAKNTDENIIKEFDDNRIRLSKEMDPFIFTGFRHWGIRMVPHLPCSFDCEESSEFAQQWYDLFFSENEPLALKTKEMMDWPIEWDALKGIALISTPVNKISVKSVGCYPKYIVQKEGVEYPDEAPMATKFPWKQPEEKKFESKLPEGLE